MAQLRLKADIIQRLKDAGKTPPTGKASFDEMIVPDLKAFARSEGVDLSTTPPPPPKKRPWMGGPRKSHKKEKGLLHKLTHKRKDW